MRKNGFLPQFGWRPMADRHRTTIQYQQYDEFHPYDQFRCEERRKFERYITDHFRPGSRGLPKMSELLLRKFRASLFEIFWNAVEHAETSLGIFSCGQFFPRKERLDFTIADLGIGIRERVRRYIGTEISADDAIGWAMDGHTTRARDSRRPGGSGLKLIREFVELNKGRIIVVSDVGYWELANGQVNVKRFACPFPGTVVTVEINTSGTASYCLTKEVDPSNIF